jgi:hypothetical protein
MRVSAEHAFEIGDIELFSKHIDSVSTVQAESGLFQKRVRELFETDGSGELARFPEHSRHFPVCPQTRGMSNGLHLAHRSAYHPLKLLPVRLAGGHELSHRELGVEEDQLAAGK